MSSVSTWSLYLRESLQFAHQEEGIRWRHDFFGPVLKQALDHVNTLEENRVYLGFLSSAVT